MIVLKNGLGRMIPNDANTGYYSLLSGDLDEVLDGRSRAFARMNVPISQFLLGEEIRNTSEIIAVSDPEWVWLQSMGCEEYDGIIIKTTMYFSNNHFYIRLFKVEADMFCHCIYTKSEDKSDILSIFVGTMCDMKEEAHQKLLWFHIADQFVAIQFSKLGIPMYEKEGYLVFYSNYRVTVPESLIIAKYIYTLLSTFYRGMESDVLNIEDVELFKLHAPKEVDIATDLFLYSDLIQSYYERPDEFAVTIYKHYNFL